MGLSAGAGPIAIISPDYPQVKKVLLMAPSVDAGKTTIEGAFCRFGGKVYIAVGDYDECIEKDAGEYFLGLSTGARKKKLVIIPNCDHQFQGSIYGKIIEQGTLLGVCWR